jgi:hypothetical protein
MASIRKEIKKETKWEVIYEDDTHISIWKYDSKITTAGPVEVIEKAKPKKPSKPKKID